MSQMPGLVDGKVALVAGAASGIGRATARLMAREGAAGVVVADLNDDGGEETVALAEQDGGKAHYVRTAVTSAPAAEALLQAAADTFGPPHPPPNNPPHP